MHTGEDDPLDNNNNNHHRRHLLVLEDNDDDRNDDSPVSRAPGTRPTSPVRDVIIVSENDDEEDEEDDEDDVTGAAPAVAAATIVPTLRRIGIEVRLHSSGDHRAPMTHAERVRDRTRRALQ